MRSIVFATILAAAAGSPLAAQTVAPVAPTASTAPEATAAPAAPTTTTVSTSTTTTTTAPQLKIGAAVKGSDEAAAGTIEAIEGDMVTVKLASGAQARIPKTGLRANADGTASVGLTAAALEAQVKAAPAPAKPTEAPKKK